MLGLDRFIRTSTAALRGRELRFLARRKYLDAVCVLLWAILPVLVPLTTFTTACTPMFKQDLTGT